jgi:hypothetical protein
MGGIARLKSREFLWWRPEKRPRRCCVPKGRQEAAETVRRVKVKG